MSYILDALKKSEKERQRGTVPDLMTTQDVMEEIPKRRPLWPYLLVGALVLNAGFLAGWLVWRSGKPPIVAQPAATQQRVAKTPDQGNRPAGAGSSVAIPQSAVSGDREPVTRSAEENKPVSGPKSPAAIKDVPKADGIRQSVQEPVKAGLQKNKEDKPAQTQTTNEKGPSRVAAAPPQQMPEVKRPDSASEPATLPAPVPNKLYSLQELPTSLRQSLPDFAISTHLFASDASSRMVRINGQSLREGQFLTAGLKVEEITSEGVVFSYQNYRFRVGLK